jgi:lysophospholipase L1-like esterase
LTAARPPRIACARRCSSRYRIKVAAEHGIPIARVYEAFNGRNGDEDPLRNGYVITDSLHPSDAGADLIAKLIRERGYACAP